jgi:hypothetical protein
VPELALRSVLPLLLLVAVLLLRHYRAQTNVGC